MNKFICTGNLTKDVELRYTQQGKAVASGAIAVNYGYGEHKKTIFMKFTAWEKKAEAMQTLTKGKKLLLEGRLEDHVWTNKEGQEVKELNLTVENIEFLSPREPQVEQTGHEKHYEVKNTQEEVVIPGEEEMF